MLQSVSLSPITNHFIRNPQKTAVSEPKNDKIGGFVLKSDNIINNYSINTILSDSDKKKYILLIDFLKDIQPSKNSDGLRPSSQLEILLKNGKLLSKSNDDKSTTLDNLYDIATVERAENLDSKRLICDILDILMNPRYVTQDFGDIPESEKNTVLSKQNSQSDVVNNPELMNIDKTGSGVCPAASLEVNAAHRYPADYVRWISKLSSKDKVLYLNLNLKSISKDPLQALTILKLFGANNTNFSFKDNKLKLTLDDNAYIRAKIQQNHWNEGERNSADVIFQSAVMSFASQNTYDALTDWRAPLLSPNTQGLLEVEKTFAESVFKNKEISSLVYRIVDDDQNLLGYTCPVDRIVKHITDTLDSGDDVIIGYVDTNETAGVTKSQGYNEKIHGAPNHIVNGHEITIVDYIRDKSGKIDFVCVDTDDNSKDFVICNQDWLLPKIHHAGYPAELVEADEKEILSQLN